MNLSPWSGPGHGPRAQPFTSRGWASQRSTPRHTHTHPPSRHTPSPRPAAPGSHKGNSSGGQGGPRGEGGGGQATPRPAAPGRHIDQPQGAMGGGLGSAGSALEPPGGRWDLILFWSPCPTVGNPNSLAASTIEPFMPAFETNRPEASGNNGRSSQSPNLPLTNSHCSIAAHAGHSSGAMSPQLPALSAACAFVRSRDTYGGRVRLWHGERKYHSVSVLDADVTHSCNGCLTLPEEPRTCDHVNSSGAQGSPLQAGLDLVAELQYPFKWERRRVSDRPDAPEGCTACIYKCRPQFPWPCLVPFLERGDGLFRDPYHCAEVRCL